eukprot:COSAG06_NODE_180_length_20940_cov_7.005758_8_plen_302_part_00
MKNNAGTRFQPPTGAVCYRITGGMQKDLRGDYLRMNATAGSATAPFCGHHSVYTHKGAAKDYFLFIPDSWASPEWLVTTGDLMDTCGPWSAGNSQILLDSMESSCDTPADADCRTKWAAHTGAGTDYEECDSADDGSHYTGTWCDEPNLRVEECDGGVPPPPAPDSAFHVGDYVTTTTADGPPAGTTGFVRCLKSTSGSSKNLICFNNTGWHGGHDGNDYCDAPTMPPCEASSSWWIDPSNLEQSGKPPVPPPPPPPPPAQECCSKWCAGCGHCLPGQCGSTCGDRSANPYCSDVPCEYSC